MEYRFRQLDADEVLNLLKPIEKKGIKRAITTEEVAQTLSAKEFYRMDDISKIKENDPRIEGVSKIEDINIEDMKLDDKIELAKKVITNIFDNRKDNESVFLNTFIELKKLSEKFIYDIDPEYVDESEEATEEEQPPEFEEALQATEQGEEIAPEEQTEEPLETEETNQEEDELINQALA